MAGHGSRERSLHHALRARADELADVASNATDTVARALSDALDAARRAGRWLEVAELARALEAHQRAREGVVDLAARRRRAGRST
ncbi:MAG TPA: hypothetical protein VI197_33095 [Polyangiaceae bacterium]